MKIGTRSVLYGAHQFILHPLCVAAAWWKLYGFPADIRLWCAFFLHDVGYIGAPNMDGPEGKRHVEVGARIMGRLFGPAWRDFCLYHSRFYAKYAGRQFSRLCVADKLSFCYMPYWLYLPMARATGEIREYRAIAESSPLIDNRTDMTWWRSMAVRMQAWAIAHKGGAVDTWTEVR